jgi:hypothetical protein
MPNLNTIKKAAFGTLVASTGLFVASELTRKESVVICDEGKNSTSYTMREKFVTKKDQTSNDVVSAVAAFGCVASVAVGLFATKQGILQELQPTTSPSMPNIVLGVRDLEMSL